MPPRRTQTKGNSSAGSPHELERRSLEFLEVIEDRGGFIASIADGWLMRQAEEGNSRLVGDIEAGRRRVVGVNAHPIDDSILEVEAFEGRSGQQSWENAMERLAELRRTRSETGTKRSLDNLCRTLDSDDNLIPAVMNAVQADASIGEIGHSFRKVLGNWTPPASF